MGCVDLDLAFVPTVLAQLACSFLNLITPNGIGGTALQLDYLHKQGVPARVGRERHGAEHRGRRRDPDGAVPVALSITATTFDSSSGSSGGSAASGAIAIVAALIGIVLGGPQDPRQGGAGGQAGR